MRTGPMDFTGKSDAVGRWTAVALGASIPVSVALDNLLLLLVLVTWILGRGYREKLELVRTNSPARCFLALFAVLLAGALAGGAPVAEAMDFLGKYDDFFFVALFIPLFREPRVRRYALTGFALAMAVTLLLSYLIAAGVLPATPLFDGDPHNPTVFKLHITQNLLMAFAAYLFAVAARHQAVRWKRFALFLLAGLAIFNVLFMVQGRTGYVVLGALMVYYFYDWLGWKGIAAGITAIALLTGAAFFTSTAFHQRLSLGLSEFSQWHPGRASETSIGLRLEWYRNSLAIIREHPFFGVGTGNFANAYAEKVKGTGMELTRNPHNEYFLITVQTGIVGLGLLLYLFYRQWRLAVLLPTRIEYDIARGLVLTIALGSLFNSLLLDHTEGLFYAWMSALLYAGLNPALKAGGSP